MQTRLPKMLPHSISPSTSLPHTVTPHIITHIRFLLLIQISRHTISSLKITSHTISPRHHSPSFIGDMIDAEVQILHHSSEVMNNLLLLKVIIPLVLEGQVRIKVSLSCCEFVRISAIQGECASE